MTTLPLAGRRVVVTRAADQADELVARLEALGADAMTVPLIEIVDATDEGVALEEALGRLSSYDWLVVSSPNGAARVADAVAGAAFGHPRLAAVGTATARALGRDADLVPIRQIAEGLVEEFPRGTGGVLVVQGEAARPELAEGLASKGWVVDVVAAYRTVPVSPSSAQLLAALSADAVLFASGSAIRAWVAVFGTQTPAFVVVIGPATAAVGADLGLKIDAVAADHSLDGLVGAVLTQLGDSD